MSVMEAGGGGDNDRPLVQILVSMLVSVGKGGGLGMMIYLGGGREG